MTKPTNEELSAALEVLWYALTSKTTRDARSYIGLGIDHHFPCMPGPVNSVAEAREVLRRARPDLKLEPIRLSRKRGRA